MLFRSDTPFHRAVRRASWEYNDSHHQEAEEALAIVERLLQGGADPNQKDGSGDSPLDAKYKNPKLIELLDRYK